MTNRWVRYVALALVGFSSLCAFGQSCGETVPQIRKKYFTKIGIGADYGPHYPCYDIPSGAVVPCFNNTGQFTPNAQGDAKNSEMQASVPLDMNQLAQSGFRAVRAYGDPAKVWIEMINQMDAINTATGKNLSVVYQVSTCKSDDANGPNGPCINVPGQTFNQVVAFSLVQLRQVIQQVTAAKFQRVAKLIIVGNEDLVISPTDHMTYNTQDLISAQQQTKAELAADGVTVSNGSNGGVDLSSATVIGQMSTAPGMALAASYPPSSPVIENIYGAQFGFVKTPADAIAFLQKQVVQMQSHYANRPAMLGETGWWTAGQDAGYDASTRVGTLQDAVAYYKLLYPYVRTCSVPTLIFEIYDEPTKGPSSNKPNPAGTLQAEEHYGVYRPYNSVKNQAMLPTPGNYNQDTSQATLFTFVMAQNPVSPVTIGIQQTGQQNPTKITYHPFMQNNPGGNMQAIWPTLNLYKGWTVYLYRAVSSPPQCFNKVTSVFSTSQPDLINPGRFVPPFSGGLWQNPNNTAPGCPNFTDTSVNWGNGDTAQSYAQNVFASWNFLITH